jgi:hypothetical protein
MVMDVRPFPVLSLFVFLAVIVAVSQQVVVVLVRMPASPVLPLAEHTFTMMVGHMVMVMAVHSWPMRVLWLFSLAFCTLICPTRHLVHVSHVLANQLLGWKYGTALGTADISSRLHLDPRLLKG